LERKTSARIVLGGIYEDVAAEEVRENVRTGRMVSSAFVVWQGERKERKGRFVINFARQRALVEDVVQDGDSARLRSESVEG
jgi:hypothetical protein